MSELSRDPLPWQGEQWKRLQSRRNADQLPHAMLFHGPDGVGKRWFAEAFARSLLCRQPHADGRACGTCRACLLFSAGTHPDMVRIEPAEDRRDIVVDQVRELRHFMALASHEGRFKITLIDPAPRMNVNAANALLKTLEEPQGATVLILITNQIGTLLPTIRSRCQRVEFPVPPAAETAEWLRARIGSAGEGASALLALAGRAPLRALRLHDDNAPARHAQAWEELCEIAEGRTSPVSVAERWSKGDKYEALEWLAGFLMEIVRLKFQLPSSLTTEGGVAPKVRNVADRVDLKGLYDVLDCVQTARQESGNVLNTQLLLEDVLIRWEWQGMQSAKSDSQSRRMKS
jgi:DNA polymerase-3 subunit delta'